MADSTETTTWPELAASLYDKLTGRGAEICYAFDSFELQIPSSATPEAMHACWKMNGTVRISTRNDASAKTSG